MTKTNSPELRYAKKLKEIFKNLPESLWASNAKEEALSMGIPDELALVIYDKQKPIPSPFNTVVYGSAKDMLHMAFLHVEDKFVEKKPDVRLVIRGENTAFFEYRDGVYVEVHDSRLLIMIDHLLVEKSLFDYRRPSDKKDVLERVRSKLEKTAITAESIDAQPFRICFRNGLYDLETDTLSPHSPLYFITSKLPFNYDKNAPSPCGWNTFLNDALVNDSEMIAFVQEIFGYCLSPDTSLHSAFFFTSPLRGTGKSTCIEVMRHIIGKNNVASLSLDDISKGEFNLASLIGKQLNIRSEISSRHLESDTISTIVSGEPITIQVKHKESITMKLPIKFIFAGNKMPSFNHAQGMLRRAVEIPFDNVVPEDKRILNLSQKLVDEEASGIILWALEGWRRLKDRGRFEKPQIIKDKAQQFTIESSSVDSFLEDSEYVSHDPDSSTTAKELYGSSKRDSEEMYLHYCRAYGNKPFSFIQFSRELSRYAKERTLEIVVKHNTNTYKGLSKIIPAHIPF